MNKTAVMVGGTFAPITKAHLEMGIQAKKKYPEADILYIPSNLEFIAGWKELSDNKIFGDAYRLELIRRAVSPYGFQVRTLEAEKKVDGTTYQTVQQLKKEGYEKVIVCIGYDKLEEIRHWRHADKLFLTAHFLVFSRNTPEYAGIETEFDVVDLAEEFQDISSTKVREAYLAGDFAAVKAMVPECVFWFLKEGKMAFDAKKIKEEAVKWIRDWFEKNGKSCNAVVGISGGKDSSVVAALCAEALGKERVVGVLMPRGIQADIQYAYRLAEHLGIRHYVINIADAVSAVTGKVKEALSADGNTVSEQTKINLPPRIRMAVLYAVSQSLNGRVANTCNLSEDWVGYSTRYGDCAGDFSPLSRLTVTEVKAIGYELGLPQELIEKPPIDGLSGKTDEDNLGFSYDVLDKYIRTGVCEDGALKARIDELHEKNKFKLELMPCFEISL